MLPFERGAAFAKHARHDLEAFLELSEAATRITPLEDFMRDTRLRRVPRLPPPPPPISLVRRVSSGSGSAALDMPRPATPLPTVREVPVLPALVAAVIVTLLLLLASLARASGPGASPPRERSIPMMLLIQPHNPRAVRN